MTELQKGIKDDFELCVLENVKITGWAAGAVAAVAVGSAFLPPNIEVNPPVIDCNKRNNFIYVKKMVLGTLKVLYVRNCTKYVLKITQGMQKH